MDTWNTVTVVGSQKLSKALFLLETLSQDLSIAILDYLKQCEGASLLDLSIHTGFATSDLESHLEIMALSEVLCHECSDYGDFYYLNQDRINRLSTLVGQLSH